MRGIDDQRGAQAVELQSDVLVIVDAGGGVRCRKARERAEDPTALTAVEAAELKRLRKVNAQQLGDMEILRKSAAFFAKETLR